MKWFEITINHPSVDAKKIAVEAETWEGAYDAFQNWVDGPREIESPYDFPEDYWIIDPID